MNLPIDTGSQLVNAHIMFTGHSITPDDDNWPQLNLEESWGKEEKNKNKTDPML